jgi:tyrosinase
VSHLPVAVRCTYKYAVSNIKFFGDSWLHHANVDRIFALWQAIYPDSFIPAEGLGDNYGTFTIAPGTTEYSSTGLTPFTSSTTGSMYTSDTARALKNWGYTYPEISDWNQTTAQLTATVIAKVNALYNPSGASFRRKRHPRDMSSTTQYEWFVNIQVAKSDLQNSSVIFIFLGEPPAVASTWKGASNLAGSLFVSVPPNYSMGDNKRYTYGEVPLKEALAKVSISDYSEATVASYLKENLEWRIQKVYIYPCPRPD